MTVKEEQENSIAFLRSILKPGDTVWTTLRHVSGSGMSRRISLHIIQNEEPVNIDWHTARATGNNVSHNHEGINVSGCGMDMGFHLVYILSQALFPKGFKTNKKCRARNGEKIGTIDKDGGYALKQRWL